MKPAVKLECPQLFKKFPTGLLGRQLARYILHAGQQALADGFKPINIAVVVRTKNDRPDLLKIIENIKSERRYYPARIDLVVVDTESTDGTLELAGQAGATIVRMKQDGFDYPKSINLGLKAVKKDVVAVFITVGHARPALNICFGASARHFADPEVVGVYSDNLPNANASFWERIFYYLAAPIFIRMRAGAHKIKKVRLGAMQGTSCAVRVSTWQKHPFDENFAHGGEDLEWARQAFSRGETMVFDPVLTVHHSHGLNLVNFLKQVRYWQNVARQPGEFQQKQLANYRPDLFD
ncbi:MAG TPA: glycosyltransferase [Candidatus Saccharimonadales bacterium]|nr:glycosyltransferase [Candidatus Saccharimonadales bacterium]